MKPGMEPNLPAIISPQAAPMMARGRVKRMASGWRKERKVTTSIR